jgi:hypothetical protein
MPRLMMSCEVARLVRACSETAMTIRDHIRSPLILVARGPFVVSRTKRVTSHE